MSWSFGVHAVEGLLSESPETVQEVWLVRSRKPSPARERLRGLAEDAGVRFRWVDDAALRKAVGPDAVHQGVAARVSEFEYADADEVLSHSGDALIVVLDEVQDPHNLGAVIRTCAALGAAAVVIPRHRSVGVTAVVRKVAVGAERRVAVCRVVNVVRFLEDARAAGFWSYAAVVEGGEASWSVSFARRSVLVLGSEGRGVRPLVRSASDVGVTVPMSSAESLNVSVACGVLVYEWARGTDRGGAENG